MMFVFVIVVAFAVAAIGVVLDIATDVLSVVANGAI